IQRAEQEAAPQHPAHEEGQEVLASLQRPPEPHQHRVQGEEQETQVEHIGEYPRIPTVQHGDHGTELLGEDRGVHGEAPQSCVPSMGAKSMAGRGPMVRKSRMRSSKSCRAAMSAMSWLLIIVAWARPVAAWISWSPLSCCTRMPCTSVAACWACTAPSAWAEWPIAVSSWVRSRSSRSRAA